MRKVKPKHTQPIAFRRLGVGADDQQQAEREQQLHLVESFDDFTRSRTMALCEVECLYLK